LPETNRFRHLDPWSASLLGVQAVCYAETPAIDRVERLRRRQSVPPSASRRCAKAPAAASFRRSRVENSRFPVLAVRRYAESSDALRCFCWDLPRSLRKGARQ